MRWNYYNTASLVALVSMLACVAPLFIGTGTTVPPLQEVFSSFPAADAGQAGIDTPAPMHELSLYRPEPRVDTQPLVMPIAGGRPSNLTCEGPVPPITRLLPALDRGTTVLGEDGHPVQFNYGRDGSLEKVTLGPDRSTITSIQTYYPRAMSLTADGQPVPWHPHVLTVFAVNQAQIVEETALWPDGSLQKMQNMEGTRKHIVEYARDGETLLDEQWIQLARTSSEDTVLLSESRWRNDAAHTLEYSNIKNPDGTRTVTKWDVNHNVVQRINWPLDDYLNGATVVGYFPGTDKLRLQGAADWSHDTVKYFRDTGTLWYTVQISACNSSITLYDETGQHPQLRQDFFRLDRFVEGGRTTVYKLQMLTMLDNEGTETEQYFFDDDKLTSFERVGATINGIKYKKAYFSFAQGKLDLVSYWNTSSENSGPDVVDRDPQFTVDLPSVPDKDKLPLVQIDADLPMPFRQSDEHGGH